MPKLIIDDQEVQVPSGTKVIDAAEKLGIMIPRFCYHKALGSVGACRMCAVKFLEGPYKGLQMSCMIDAKDGMVVSTTDEEAVEFRRYMIEWLMLNHPHDCPVCDEGGHCLLQETTISGGHSVRRYLGKKRTYRDQYLGHLVAHEMNRCIHCYRCVRYYREYSGYRDLGTLGIANRTYFGRYTDGPLESPFAGNLIDICPTGVYTDKTVKYRVRRWDMSRASSICLHCSLGCNTTAGARYHEVLRNEARQNDKVNGFFICDRGRFGHAYESHPDRPRKALMDQSEVTVQDAIKKAGQKLREVIEKYGPGSVALLGSSRNSLETQTVISRFCRDNQFSPPMNFTDHTVAKKVRAAVGRTDSTLVVSMGEIMESDFILILGADPINEAPMLALSLRRAMREGARVVVADPRPITLPFDFEHFPVHPDQLAHFLGATVKNAFLKKHLEKASREAKGFFEKLPEEYPRINGKKAHLEQIGSQLSRCQNLLLICGTQVTRHSLIDTVSDMAHLLTDLGKKAKVFFIYPGANSYGAALFDGSERRSFTDVVGEMETGKVKAMIVVENNPFFLFPDRGRIEKALKKLELFVVLDYIPSPTMRRAAIFIPTQTIFETGGSYINQEGRVQFANAVHDVGTPIRQVTDGSHPLRVFGDQVPGGAPVPAFEAMARICESITGTPIVLDDFSALMAGQHPYLSVFENSGHPADNIRVIPEKSEIEPYLSLPLEQPPTRAENEFQLITVEWTFGTEVLSAHSKPVCKVENSPFIYMHRDDAALAGLENAQRIILPLKGGALELQLKLSSRMARGTLILPRHRQLAWQKFEHYEQTVVAAMIKTA